MPSQAVAPYLVYSSERVLETRSICKVTMSDGLGGCVETCKGSNDPNISDTQGFSAHNEGRYSGCPSALYCYVIKCGNSVTP